MSKSQSIIIPTVIILLAVLLSVFAVSGRAQSSTDFGNYQYSPITSDNASSTSPYTIWTRQGTLGSIVVGSQGTTTAPIGIYDSASATSTATLIGIIEGGAQEGTYTFDVQVTNGITLDVPGTFDGTYTATYRR